MAGGGDRQKEVNDSKDVDGIATRFKQSLAAGGLFTFMIGGTRHGVTRVGSASGTDGLVLMVIGVPLEHFLREVSEENRAKIKALPLLQIPSEFEGVPVDTYSDE